MREPPYIFSGFSVPQNSCRVMLEENIVDIFVENDEFIFQHDNTSAY